MTATSASRRPSPGLLATIAVVVAALPAPARAQFFQSPAPQNIEGLTVVGKATVGARPNLAEVELDVSASAELTGDAIVKFRDSKKRVHDAFAALKLANVVVEERGLLVDQKGAMINPYYMMDYGQNTKTKTEVQLSRKLVVKASDIAAMDEEAVLQLVGRLLDVAQDAGAHVGPSADMNMYYYRYGMQPTTGLVRFVVEDYEQVQEKAYEQAVADARARAERLARLSGLELGPVLAIREVVAPDDQAASPTSIFMPTPAPSDDPPRKRLETSKFQEIPVRVELQLRFAIHPKADGKAGRSSQ
jgi:uncharacterized protein YggE